VFGGSKRFPLRLVALALAFAVALSGCGKGAKKAEVSGKVTIDNRPVTSGTVTFISSDGKRTAVAQLDAQGEYNMPDAPVGPVKITVEAKNFTAFGKTQPPPKGIGPMAPPGGDASEGGMAPVKSGPFVPIPLRYKDADKSGLTYTVETGKQTHDIPLTKKG